MPIYNLDDLIAQNERTQRAVDELVASASATTGHALTTDAGQSWVSNVTPEELANMTLTPGKITGMRAYDGAGRLVMSSGAPAPYDPALYIPHWSDDFAPLPVIDPGMLESRTELDPGHRYLLRTQTMDLAEAQRMYPALFEQPTETRSEREDTIARIWDGMVTAMTLAQKPETHSAVLAALQDCAIYGTGWVGGDFGDACLPGPAVNRPFSVRQGLRKLCATHSDSDAISDEQARAALKPPAAPEPVPTPRNVKPALAGLGVTAPEDHRLGGWKQL